MKYLLIILICLIGFVANSQQRFPSGIPTQFSTGFFKQGYHQSDSGTIIANRDTNWLAKYSGTVVYKPSNKRFYWFDSTTLKWNQFGSTVDTTSLSNRINLKLNISDTVGAWLGQATRFVDTMYRVNDSTVGYTIKGAPYTFQILGRLPSGGGGSGTVTSVGLSLPSAFNVTPSTITTSGTFSVTGAGTASQYIRGNGTLATFDTSAIPNFYLKVRGLLSGTSPITFNQTTGGIGINNATATGTKGAAAFTGAFSDNGSGTIDLLTLGAAGSCTGCNLNIDAKGRITGYSDGAGGATNNANIGAGYRWLNGITQELRTVANSPTITWDSVSTANTLTAKVDTSLIATQYDISQFEAITANNGLTKTAGNIQVGGELVHATKISGGASAYAFQIDSSASISLFSGLEYVSSGVGSFIQMSDSVTNIGASSTTDFTSITFSPTRIKFLAADGAGSAGDVWTNTGSGYGHWAAGSGGGGATLNNIGTGFAWAATPGGDIKRVANSNTILWDSASTASSLTAKVDTSNVVGTKYDISLKQNQFVFNVKDFGAKGDGKKMLDGAITSSTNILTSSTANFSSADVGKLIIVIEAGAGNTDLRTTISGFTNSTTVTLTDNAVVSVAGAVFWYGTNDRPAILSAIAAMPSMGGNLIFPTGFYYCRGGAITIEKQVTFLGMGHHETYQEAATSIMTDSLAGDFIRVRSIVSFLDISIDNLNINSIPIAGSGINLNASNGASIRNTSVRGFYDNIRTDSAGHWLIDGLWCDGWVNAGVRISANTASPDYGDPIITNSFFNATIRDNQYGILQNACGGLKVSNVKFNHDGLGHQMYIQINIDITSATSDLLVTNCSFENFTGAALVINSTPSQSFGNIVFGNNQIAPYQTIAGPSIVLFNVSNLVFSNNDILAPTTGYCALFQFCNKIQWKGNDIRGATGSPVQFLSCTEVSVDRPMTPQTLIDAATIAFDVSLGNNAVVTLGANRTLSITNAVPGEEGSLLVNQSGGGGFTLNFGSGNTVSPVNALNFFGPTKTKWYYDGTNFRFVVDELEYTKRDWVVPGFWMQETGATGTLMYYESNILKFQRRNVNWGSPISSPLSFDMTAVDNAMHLDNAAGLSLVSLQGDSNRVLYGDPGGKINALTNGTNGQVLTIVGNNLAWSSVSGATTIYNGDGTLSADRTVTGSGNDLTYNSIFNYRINANSLLLAESSPDAVYSVTISGANNQFLIGYTPTPTVYSKGYGVYIDTNNNAGLAIAVPTTVPLYATGNSAYVNGLQSGGGNYYKVTNITGNATAAIDQYWFNIDATSGNVTLTLPAASTAFGGFVGIQYVFKRTDNSGNTVTIARAGSDTIDGATSISLTTQYEAKEIQCVSTSAWAIK